MKRIQALFSMICILFLSSAIFAAPKPKVTVFGPNAKSHMVTISLRSAAYNGWKETRYNFTLSGKLKSMETVYHLNGKQYHREHVVFGSNRKLVKMVVDGSDNHGYEVIRYTAEDRRLFDFVKKKVRSDSRKYNFMQLIRAAKKK